MDIAYIFPAAFTKGFEAAKRYYARVNAGEIKEGEGYEAHPYEKPEGPNSQTEWHAYNAGWYHGIPD